MQVDSIGKECLQAGHFYLYKDVLPVGFLGLVDDVIGITSAGYQAQMMNGFLNVKSAEKKLYSLRNRLILDLYYLPE